MLYSLSLDRTWPFRWRGDFSYFIDSQDNLHWRTPLRSLSPMVNPALTSPPCPHLPHLHIFWTLPGMVTPPLPWASSFSVWQPFQWRNFSEYPIQTFPVSSVHIRFHVNGQKGKEELSVSTCLDVLSKKILNHMFIPIFVSQRPLFSDLL